MLATAMREMLFILPEMTALAKMALRYTEARILNVGMGLGCD